jgi:hypothetical protein
MRYEVLRIYEHYFIARLTTYHDGGRVLLLWGSLQ